MEIIKENELEKLLDKYDSKFREKFPRFYLKSWDENLLCEEIKESLKTGVPFNPYKDIANSDVIF